MDKDEGTDWLALRDKEIEKPQIRSDDTHEAQLNATWNYMEETLISVGTLASSPRPEAQGGALSERARRT